MANFYRKWRRIKIKGKYFRFSSHKASNTSHPPKRTSARLWMCSVCYYTERYARHRYKRHERENIIHTHDDSQCHSMPLIQQKSFIFFFVALMTGPLKSNRKVFISFYGWKPPLAPSAHRTHTHTHVEANDVSRTIYPRLFHNFTGSLLAKLII